MDRTETILCALDIKDPPCDEQPFRFLDLPKELRLMVYERLVNRSHKTVELEHGGGYMAARSAILVTPDPVSPVYFTCKLIYSEATPMLKALDHRNSQPRMIIDLGKMKQVSLVQLDLTAWIAKCLSICCVEDQKSWLHRDSYIRCGLECFFDRFKKDIPIGLQTFLDFKSRTVDRLRQHGRTEGVDLDVAIQCPASSDGDMTLCIRELVRSLHKILGQRTRQHKVTVYTAPDNKHIGKASLAYDPTVLRIGKAIDKSTWRAEWM